jgi:hypothetical protein
MGNGPLYIEEPSTGDVIWACNTADLGGPNITQYYPLFVESDATVTGAVSAATITATEGLSITEGGSAPQMGVLTLTGLTAVTVSTTAVQSNSRIFLSVQAPSLTVGQPRVTARTAGTSFTVASIALDTSTIAWLLVNPA